MKRKKERKGKKRKKGKKCEKKERKKGKGMGGKKEEKNLHSFTIQTCGVSKVVEQLFQVISGKSRNINSVGLFAR